MISRTGLRGMATAAQAAPKAYPAGVPAARDMFKKQASRKTYLMDRYTHMLRTKSVFLVFHQNAQMYRDQAGLKSAIRAAGGEHSTVATSLMRATLRGLETEDPLSKQANAEHKDTIHPLAQLFKGSASIVSFDSLDPRAVEAVLKLTEKTGDRMLLVGAFVNGQTMSIDEVNVLKKLPSMADLHGQLAGLLTVLGGGGLVQALEAPGKLLYLNLDQHAKGETQEKKE
ncbi:54S ribosomal protein L11 [Yarrowia sp. B02]|nr:54S ribosomal protein L11 [Yarrowia sp. B02]